MVSTRYFNGKSFEVEELSDGMVKVGRSGTDFTVTVSEQELSKWQGGAYIQDAMPTLSAEEREFLISGFTPHEWNIIFGDDDDSVDERLL